VSIRLATNGQWVSCRFLTAEPITAVEIVSGLSELVAGNELPDDEVLKVQLIGCSVDQSRLFSEVVGDLVMYGESAEHGVELDLERGYDFLALCVTAQPSHRSSSFYLYEVVRSSDESIHEVGALLLA
jgi:hypothetical protein